MLHAKGQLMANIKHWSTALSVVSKLSSAVVKQLLVNVVHYICTAIKEKPTKEWTWLIVTPLLVILTGQQVNHHLKFTEIKAYCVVTFCCNDGQNQHWGNYIRTKQNIEWKSETYINLHLFFSCPFPGIKMYTSLSYTMKLASVPGEDSYKAL